MAVFWRFDSLVDWEAGRCHTTNHSRSLHAAPTSKLVRFQTITATILIILRSWGERYTDIAFGNGNIEYYFSLNFAEWIKIFGLNWKRRSSTNASHHCSLRNLISIYEMKMKFWFFNEKKNWIAAGQSLEGLNVTIFAGYWGGGGDQPPNLRMEWKATQNWGKF